MSQHDFDISTLDANTGANFRIAVNAALQALASQNAGPTAPATTYAHQKWFDTSTAPPIIKTRTEDNTAWAVDSMYTIRQTVLAASTDAYGLPNFISIGAGLSVNIAATAAPIRISSANGYNGNGAASRIGSVVADTVIAGLNANQTNYLYADVAANGSVVFGKTTVAPVYQFGGAYSVSNEQFTFNIQEMIGKVGNGSAAVQTYRVFIGEAVCGASTVTSVTNYALMGRYDSGLFSVAANTSYAKSHNLGIAVNAQKVTMADDSVGTNERAAPFISWSGATAFGFYSGVQTRNSSTIWTSANNIGFTTTGAAMASGYYRLVVQRGW